MERSTSPSTGSASGPARARSTRSRFTEDPSLRAGGSAAGPEHPVGSIGRGSAVPPSSHDSEQLLAVGVSHRHAPLEVRERLFLAEGHAVELARELGGVVLSTCNRTEIYLAGGDAEAARDGLERASGIDLAEVLATWEGDDAVDHLFRVAAGLDSLVPGEAQILGQVRLAYEQALTAGATGPVLNRLFEDALHAGKRVRTEAKLAEMPESVAASAVDLAEKALGGLDGKHALLFGAGRMSELSARDLRGRGAEMVVSSRTLESAQELAERVGGRAAPFDAVAVELTGPDLVISPTLCPYPILHAEAAHGWRGPSTRAGGAGRGRDARRRPGRGARPAGRGGGGGRARSRSASCSPSVTAAAELYARALGLIPGGVNSPVRAMKAMGLEAPIFAARGDGAYLEDVDGHRYLDWVLSWGPLIFGHADPETVEAVVAAAREGTTFGTATEREGLLAEEIADAVPSVELVRLVSSGTEAAMTAPPLAPAGAGRGTPVRVR